MSSLAEFHLEILREKEALLAKHKQSYEYTKHELADLIQKLDLHDLARQGKLSCVVKTTRDRKTAGYFRRFAQEMNERPEYEALLDCVDVGYTDDCIRKLMFHWSPSALKTLAALRAVKKE